MARVWGRIGTADRAHRKNSLILEFLITKIYDL